METDYELGRIQAFEKLMKPLRESITLWELDTETNESPVWDLFFLFEELMRDFFSKDLTFESLEKDLWLSRFDLAGAKAHELFLKLKSSGITVIYDQTFLINRLKATNCGPESLEFHKDLNAIEDLLNFIVLGTANQEYIMQLRS